MKALLFLLSFTIAFLLFAVQPLASKLVLPTLGGTPAVWNTVMFTFQLLLLSGYVYAHALARLASVRKQVLIHAGVVAASMLFLPLWVSLETSDALVESPIRHIVFAFLTQIGLPFFCLSATAPLLQSWLSRSPHPLAKTPYVLYSASNFGSFAGLIGYIVLVEPFLDLPHQSIYGSGLFVVATALLIAVGMKLGQGANAATVESRSDHKLPWMECALWIWLAFLVSSASLGVTTYIATDVASIPLLWVVPLSIYLLSFVDAFRTRPALVGIAQRLAPTLTLFTLVVYSIAGHGVMETYLLHLLAFGMIAFALHGWLAARKPDPSRLTLYYVLISVGGMLGGVMNGLLAPVLLRDALEYPVVMLLAATTAFILLRRAELSTTPLLAILRTGFEAVGMTAVATGLVYLTLMHIAGLDPAAGIHSLMLMRAAALGCVITILMTRKFIAAYFAATTVAILGIVAVANGVVSYQTLFKDRNFFGVSRVYEHKETNARYYMHGTTLHGLQSLDAKDKMGLQSYYSGVKASYDRVSRLHQKPIALIGLGVGTLKCMARPAQAVDVFEIDPLVRDIAHNAEFFTYLSDCPSKHETFMGDGRLRIAQQADGRYGTIVIDAFSSDAIPAHLLTREAFETYVKKLAPGGLIFINVTNRHIDLWPILGTQAEALDLIIYGKRFKVPEDKPLLRTSHWVVIGRTQADVAAVVGGGAKDGWEKLAPGGGRPWTDNYTNLIPYFKILR